MKVTVNTNSYTQVQQTKTTSIQHNNAFQSEADKRQVMLDEKYSLIHKENMRQKDPEQHISDKYSNPYSPKYRSDLTAEERDAAWRMEMDMMKYGKIGNYYFRDAMFRGNDLNGNVENHQKKAFQRDQVNGQLQNLFAEAGLTIPNDLSLHFAIDPNNYAVKVTGTSDKTLIEQIERILNEEKNGAELFLHIFKSLDDDSTQMSADKRRKFTLINTIRSVGYDLRDLERKNGQFLTPEGEDVFELYLNKMRANPYEKNYVSAAASHFGPTYYELAKNGFDSLPDLMLSISYKNGQLQDIGQQANYSDKSWIEKLHASNR